MKIPHAILIAYRNLFRSKTTFFINLLGLSSGLLGAILIYLWVHAEWKVDRFHDYNERLYQVLKNAEVPNSPVMTFSWTPAPLAGALQKEMPEVEYSLALLPYSESTQGVANVGDKAFKAKECFTQADFFKAFSFPLLEGSPDFVLKNARSVVITEGFAKKLFGSAHNLIGKKLNWNQEELSGTYQISGIMQDFPPHSTLQFDLIFSLEDYAKEHPEMQDWAYGHPSTYVVLKEGVSKQAFQEKISGYLQTKSEEAYQSLLIAPFANRYLYGNYENCGKLSRFLLI